MAPWRAVPARLAMWRGQRTRRIARLVEVASSQRQRGWRSVSCAAPDASSTERKPRHVRPAPSGGLRRRGARRRARPAAARPQQSFRDQRALPPAGAFLARSHGQVLKWPSARHALRACHALVMTLCPKYSLAIGLLPTTHTGHGVAYPTQNAPVAPSAQMYVARAASASYAMSVSRITRCRLVMAPASSAARALLRQWPCSSFAS
mmetsp:Transcript_94031/g.265539  ORF Transcript_94031/g.265539 Transcript_94031/m.265539 type:complete len:206 (-) Transcript_94031:825-1442(-)